MQPFDRLHEICYDIKNSILTERLIELWDGRRRKKENYLDYVFMKNPAYAWKEKEDGLVCLIIEWKGFYHWLAQKVFHRPKQSEIAMDVLGSFCVETVGPEKEICMRSPSW